MFEFRKVAHREFEKDNQVIPYTRLIVDTEDEERLELKLHKNANLISFGELEKGDKIYLEYLPQGNDIKVISYKKA